MIASGEKKEEYRDIKKYWQVRFEEFVTINDVQQDVFREYDYIHFTNGYGSKCRSINVEWKGISIGIGKYEWGGGYKQYIIKLGEIIR